MRASRLTAALAGLAGVLALAPPAAAKAPPRAGGALAEWSPRDDERRAPHHARSFLEMGAGLALGSTGYWILMERNVADWDNPQPEQRFDGSAWVFDNNSLGVNFLGHPLWGGLSHSFARANHQSVWGAFGYSFLTSFVWEFVLEFKEKVSVNDVLVTPGAGLPIGEFLYKLGLYLDTGDGSRASVDVARWLLGTGVALDRSLDGRPAPRVLSRDRLGFSRAIWHEFVTSYGVSSIDSPSWPAYARYHAALQGRLVTLPGYLAARSFGRPFYAAELSDLSVAGEASRYGAGLWLQGSTMLVGYHAQRAREAHFGAPRAEAVTLGSSVAFDYFRSSANRYRSVENAVRLPEPGLSYHDPNRREQFAGFHLPGLSAELRLHEGWLGLDVAGRIHPSFGGLGAAAFYDWAAQNLQERGKHILHRQGYFYGWGAFATLRAKLSLGPLRAGFDVDYASYASQDGLDRHVEQVTVDVPAQGDMLAYSGSLGVAPGSGSVSVGARLGVRRLRSTVGGFERTARAVERGLSATWMF